MVEKKRDGSPRVDVFMALLNLSLFSHIANIEEILHSCAVLQSNLSSSVFFWAFSLFFRYACFFLSQPKKRYTDWFPDILKSGWMGAFRDGRSKDSRLFLPVTSWPRG